MKNFIISTDSCTDLFKSFLNKNGVRFIIMKRVLNGKEIGELYDSAGEFDSFYEGLKKGAKPTTVALNPTEMQMYFEEIIAKEPAGDIIHIPLSSGLSATCSHAINAAAEVNKTLNGRKIHVIDSLSATAAMDFLIHELIKLRDDGATAAAAIKRIENLRDHTQGWAIMSDLFNLKRGGRISGVKATIGTILNVKPILYLNKVGKLAIENKMKGSRHAINYILGKMYELGEKLNKNFATSTVCLARTSQSQLFDDLKAALTEKYPGIQIKEGIVGPIIGTHLGCGGAIIVFEGAERLDIN